MAAPDRSAFVQSLLPIAKAWEQKTGIPVSMWLAMAASESNWGAAGTSLFGIKGSGNAGSLSSPTWESVGGQRVNTSDNFASYKNANDAFQAFWDLVSTAPRYADAVRHLPDDPQGFLQGINRAGYATDPNWSSSIQSIASNQIEPLVGTTKGQMHPVGASSTDGTPDASPTGPLTPEEIQSAMALDNNPDSTGSGFNNSLGPKGLDTSNQGDNGIAGNVTPGGYAPSEWQSLVQQHGGIASTGPSKQVQVNDPNASPFDANVKKVWQADPSSPSIVAFNDGTVVLARFSGDAKNPSSPVQVFAWPGSKSSATPKILASGPSDKYVLTVDPTTGHVTATPNKNYVEPTPKVVGGAGSSDPFILKENPTTGELTKEPNPNYVPPKPQIIQQSDGSILSFDPSTGQVTKIQGANSLLEEEAQLRIAAAQRAIMPEQQKMFTDASATIDMIKQKAASGQMSYQEANALVDEIHQNLQAALQGTTLFEQQKQKQLIQQQQATQAADMLRSRVTEGANLAHSLLTAAAGHVLMPAGQSTLGIDPYAIAKAEVNDLGGGADLYSKAASMLSNYLSGSGGSSPTTGSSGAGVPSAPTPGDPRGLTAPPMNGGPAADFRHPGMTPTSPNPWLAALLGGLGGMPPPMNGGPAADFRQQALAPRGPAILQALLGGAGAQQ